MKRILVDLLVERQIHLAKEIEVLEKRIETAPEGKLRIGKSNGATQYYVRNNPLDNIGKYIKANDKSIAKALAQKSYDEKELANAKNEKSLIDRLLSFLRKKRNVFDELSTKRKELVSPYELSDDAYSKLWLSEQYNKKDSGECYPIETEKGDYVRSKSEAMIANMLFHAGIPYKYEHPIRLANGKDYYPDFTILNKRTRQVIYLEHFGKMDDEKYRDEFFYKIHLYTLNGIIIGKNLIVSFEGSGSGHWFDTMLIKKLISDCLT